ncbi:hypothetical protein EYF80_066663 [Liparis tanakae]|uniref:Uncharacterized protein n=1 Tax=Liparis tanakae TaxID=230148 RepID=A0A4Z2E384_9TELE|nr:hypothetical protein EYF80_066663 [Liparis tanakae]
MMGGDTKMGGATTQDPAQLGRQPEAGGQVDVSAHAQPRGQLLHRRRVLPGVLEAQHVHHWGRSHTATTNQRAVNLQFEPREPTETPQRKNNKQALPALRVTMATAIPQ